MPRQDQVVFQLEAGLRFLCGCAARRCLSAAVLAGLIHAASAQVTVQVVNDSGNADANVYIKVPGQLWAGITNQPVTPANLFVNTSLASPPSPSSIALSTLTQNGQLVSSVSGNTNKVYQFTADFINSGSIYFTYNQPFNFSNGVQPSPPPNSSGNAYRYDYAELSINDSNAPFNAVDVTYVDKFGIPLQMEWFHGTNLVAGSYVYASTKTLANLFTAAGLGQAVFALGSGNITPGWQYTNSNSYTNFARILAPQKISGGGTSIAPYPGVTNYLNSLLGSSNAFWLNGASPQGGYYYVGYRASISTNSTGWLVTLANAPNPPAFNPTLILGTQYTNTITFPIPYANAGQYLYGAPVGPNLYSVNGTLVTSAAGPTYQVETWMIGDVLSSLNFGFWGGRYGTNSANWFSPVEWTAYPYGSARLTPDDGYNLYAALIYDNADPYSFAFSERITPDVLMSPVNGDTLRITLLPDDRLDSPVVLPPATNMVTTNSITLNWTQVSGATGYQVNVLRPPNVIPPVSLPSSASSYTLTNLLPGTPYVMSVQATGTAAGNPVITPARPVSATTTGTTVPVKGKFTYIQVAFNAADPFYQLGQVFINGIKLVPSNGQWLTNGVPARWIASAGTNQVVVTVVGTNNQVLFNDWLTFDLAQPFAVTNGTTVTTNSAISNIFLYGQKLSQPAPGVSGFLNGTTATNFLVSTQNISMVIGLTYVPAETRKYAAVTGPAAPILVLTQAATPGAFQFEYTNTSALTYSVDASTNLTQWSDIGPATLVSPGLYQFTDPNATNYPGRFYRLSSP